MDTGIPEIQVRLFGSFKILAGGMESPLPASSHARSLLAYLFLNRTKTHTRLAVATLLAPDVSEANARRLLNQTLWYIRSDFPGLLVSGLDDIALSPTYPLAIDVAGFESCLQPYLSGIGRPQDALRELNRAVALYQGDLLEGFYEDWAILERERLRELYFQALECLIQAHKSAHEYQPALNLAYRLVKGDPLRESAQREIIRLQYLLGNASAAIKHFREFQLLLQKELGMEPGSDTVELVREIARRSYQQQPPYLPETNVQAGESLLESNAGGQLPLIGRAGSAVQQPRPPGQRPAQNPSPGGKGPGRSH